MTSASDILFVVVLYKRQLANAPIISSLQKEAKLCGTILNLFVHDNSYSAETDQNLQAAKELNDWLNIHYLHSNTNVGVAKAYNDGAWYAKEHRFDWVMLLDQDTYFENPFLKAYLAALNNDGTSGVALYAPFLRNGAGHHLSPCYPLPYFTYLHRRLIKPIQKLVAGLQSFRWFHLFNSGILIHVDILLSIRFDEKVFLDFSDFDFVERLMKTLPQFQLINVVGMHGLSVQEAHGEKEDLARYKLMVKCANAYGKTWSRKWKGQAQLLRFAWLYSKTYKSNELLMIFFRNLFQPVT